MKRLASIKHFSLAPCLLVTAGCTTSLDLPKTASGVVQTATVPASPWAPSGLPMFDGENGRTSTWADLMDRIAAARVIVLGEEHDDEVAHRFQLAVVEQTIATWPDTAVALEMVERDQQAALDAYLAGESTRSAFLETVRSSEKSRERFTTSSLPIIDAAAAMNAPVIAANAPRRFVTMARLEGWDALEARDGDERALFVIPDSIHQGAYRRRLEDLMQENGVEPTTERIDAVLRAQQVWDSTMADSTLQALDGATKVILIVGRFHGDFGGGTIEELHRHAPFLDVCYVSTINEDARTLLEDDEDRADLVVYTGGVPRGSEPIDPVDDRPVDEDA